MGVHGLWKLIESSGKAIPLEALENRVLAVDVSIWLYQLVKGFQETAGHSVANAYLLGLFHRICKLLFYRIKPIFVFDGGVPVLKRRTIAERQSSRSKASRLGEKLQQALLENLAKQEALGQALGESVVLPKLFQPKQDTLFQLPPLPEVDAEATFSGSSSESEGEDEKYRYKDIHSIDITSEEFLSLPPDMRHDILTELKETRKQNSWAKFHLMPKESDEFSDFQMRRLLKRRAVQVGIEQAEGEMGSRGFTVADLESILSDQGVQLAQRIAADSKTKIFYNSTNKENKKNTEDNQIEKPTSSLVKKSKIDKFIDEFDSEIVDEPDFISNSESDSESIEDALSQKEILQLIKQENQKPPFSTSFIQEVASPSHLQARNVKAEKCSEELTVNGHGAVETKKAEDNEVKLEHGRFPQENRSRLQSTPLHQSLQDSSEPLLPGTVKYEGNGGEREIKEETANSTSRISERKRKTDSPVNLEEKRKCIPSSSIFENQNKSEEPVVVIQANKQSSTSLKSVKNISNPLGSDGNIESSSTESDDDFIEVNQDDQDHSQSEAKENSTTSSNVTKDNHLEIIVSSVDTLEDDFFADVFESVSKDTSQCSNISKPIEDKLITVLRKSHGTNDNSPPPKDLENMIHSVDSKGNDLFASVPKQTDMSSKLPNENVISSQTLVESKILEKENTTIEITNDESLCVSVSGIRDDSFAVEAVKDRPSNDATDLARVPSPVPQLSVKEIMKMKKDLERESSQLIAETSREDRISSTITEQIRLDAQELLELFGIPYIIAPLEAEAQCAYLDLTGQTQGTITNDSDIWLFGGNNVYKNFFDQKKFVQQFKATDINRVLHIGRDEMIMLALLSGSDYTLGLTGIGSVTALEIVAHYPKTDAEPTPAQRLNHFSKEFKRQKLIGSIARKLKKVSIPDGFPSAEVIEAYFHPEVDQSSDKFTWSKPNLPEIRRYTFEKFGWDRARTDKLLEPILENLGRTQTQGTLHSFFEWKFDATAVSRSRRVENAIHLMKTPSLQAEPGPSYHRPAIKEKPKKSTNNISELPVKSKTPAQIARERAAKKFKELKKQGKIGPKAKQK